MAMATEASTTEMSTAEVTQGGGRGTPIGCPRQQGHEAMLLAAEAFRRPAITRCTNANRSKVGGPTINTNTNSNTKTVKSRDENREKG